MKASVLVAAFLAGLLCGVAMSGRTADWVVSTLGSRHLGGGNFCETNPGLGLERGDEVRTLVGVYRNSLCDRWSFYLGKSWFPLQFADWRLGIAGMAITGYESPITLGAAAVLSYERPKYGFNLVLFPDSKGDLTRGVLALQGKYRW